MRSVKGGNHHAKTYTMAYKEGEAKARSKSAKLPNKLAKKVPQLPHIAAPIKGRCKGSKS